MFLCAVKRFRSISKSLTYRIMAVVLVMMVVITSVVYFTVKEFMLDEARDRYLGLLLENHQEMRRKLSDVYVAVRNNIDDIENEFDQPEKLKLPSPGSFFGARRQYPADLGIVVDETGPYSCHAMETIELTEYAVGVPVL